MLEFVVVSLAVLVGLVVAVAALVALPLMLVGFLLKLLVGLILIPFRILGALFGVVFVCCAVLLKVGLFLLAILVVGGLLSGGAVMLALTPLILLGVAIWLLVRLMRPRPSVPLASC